MIGTGLPGVPRTADPLQALAVAALQAQAEGLGTLSDRLSLARSTIPASADDTWQGPARAAYDAGLEHLRGLMTATVASVDGALAETRRAVLSLQQENG